MTVSELLVNNLDLLVDHATRKAINRDVHPVALFALNNETIGQACSIRRKAPTLRNNIDQQVPSARLIDFA